MVVPLNKRHAVGGLLAAAILGIAITFIQLSSIEVSLSPSNFASPGRNTSASTTRDFFRLWHPPWGEQPGNVKDANIFDATRPTCKRTLLYRFAGSHGFGSEYLIFIRVALIARYFSYEIMVDDSRWNYGRWNDYFKPVALSCANPRDVDDGDRIMLAPAAHDPPLAAVRLRDGRPSWTFAPHVIWATRKLDYLDQLILELYTNTSAVEDLHRPETASSLPTLPLSPAQTLPEVYRKVFQAMSRTTSSFWHLNSEMQGLVDSILPREHLSLSPRAALIAAHVRMGDKAMELHKFGPNALPKPRKTLQELYELWRAHWDRRESLAATKIRRLEASAGSAASLESEGISFATGESWRGPGADVYIQAAVELLSKITSVGKAPESPQSKYAVLLVMSDDTSGDGLRDFSQRTATDSMRIVMGLDALASEPPEVPQDKSEARIASLQQSVEVVRPGFHENTFNALPLSERVGQTKKFIRDLTAVGHLADGLVFTGSSNVGRLLALLGSQRPGLDRNMMSVDVRWFPTARYQ